MSVIVFEGPDESGKTTLINATAQVLDDLGSFYTVVKSPAGREKGWEVQWDKWADPAGKPTDHVHLLDRTPEVSEFVYGVMRGRPRLRDPLASLDRFRRYSLMLVMCLPESPIIPRNLHYDPFGHEIGYRSAQAHLLYKSVAVMLSQNHSEGFNFFRWDRYHTKEKWPLYLSRLGMFLLSPIQDLASVFYRPIEKLFPSPERLI